MRRVRRRESDRATASDGRDNAASLHWTDRWHRRASAVAPFGENGLTMPCRAGFATFNCNLDDKSAEKLCGHRRLFGMALRQREDLKSGRCHADRMLELRGQRTV